MTDPNGTFQLFTATADPTVAGFSPQNLVLTPNPGSGRRDHLAAERGDHQRRPGLSTLTVSDQAGALNGSTRGPAGHSGLRPARRVHVSLSGPGFDPTTDNKVMVPLCSGTCTPAAFNATLVPHVTLTSPRPRPPSPGWRRRRWSCSNGSGVLQTKTATGSGQAVAFTDLSVGAGPTRYGSTPPVTPGSTQDITLTSAGPNSLTAP